MVHGEYKDGKNRYIVLHKKTCGAEVRCNWGSKSAMKRKNGGAFRTVITGMARLQK